MGVKNIQANVDSKLVANQVLVTYVAKEDNMIKYLEIAKCLVKGFKTFSISQVPQSKNKKADTLSKIASTSFAHLSKQVLVEVLETKSITGKEVTAVIEEEGPTWMTKLVTYLKEGTLPANEKEARKIRLKARQYELIEGILYKRSFLTPWLRCVGPLQAEYAIKEIHEGSCSMHAGPRSVVAKAIRLGYFWPTMHRDAQEHILILTPESNRGIRSHGKANGVFLCAGSLTNSLDTRNHLKIHMTSPSGQPCRPYLCINKFAPSVGASTRSYSDKERVMANTTPLVTTVMKPTSNPGEANTAPRVNIQELCEEYYEDILPIIMEKARHERLKDVHARLDFEEGPQEGTRENSRSSNTKA
nr:reverse transcriptase domain-containing protein [Tanacetum cinerariifolium]